MQLVAPDILAEARGLTLPFSAGGLALGIMLWIFGWRWHRFWVVLYTTVVAGLIGLSGHPGIGPRMLSAGLLLAVAAGMMAIDLSRLLAFGVTGLGCWLLIHKVLPSFQEPTICFLAGGILGILLYRIQLMVLTSFAGTLLAGHSLLLLVEDLTKSRFAAADWAQANTLGLNIGVIVLALLGLAVQGQIERWRADGAQRRRGWLSGYFGGDVREHLPRHLARRRGSGSFGGRR